MQESAAAPPAPVYVQRWPTEIPLLVFVILASLGIWFLLAITIFGFVYALLIGLFFIFTHVAFVTYVRGSAVRLGPNQFPELHERVVELSRTAGLDPAPAAYVMESGGALNALASRFLRSRFIVLYSDLLDACENDTAARDMVIGHEIGHVKARHLDWMWFLVPGMFVPFLGSAYSRARELTCDRYGAALCGERAGAVRGLAILAAGRSHGPRVDLESFAAQSADLDTGWMTLGKWLSRYPPLCERISALEPELRPKGVPGTTGTVRAILILAAIFLVPSMATGIFMAVLLPTFQKAFQEAASLDLEESEPFVAPENVAAARARFDADFDEFQTMLDEYDARGNPEPEDLYEAWNEVYPDLEAPDDPFDGLPYGYDSTSDGRRLLLSSVSLSSDAVLISEQR